jgi:hypothetical protein
MRTIVATASVAPVAAKKLVRMPPICAPSTGVCGFLGIVCPRTVFSVWTRGFEGKDGESLDV